MNTTAIATRFSGRRMLFGATMSVLLVSACGGVGPTYTAGSPDFFVASRWAAFPQEPRLVDDAWLQSFRNAQLVSLVNEALVNNRDIRTAAARLEEARARARQAGAAAVPGVDLSLGAEREEDQDTEVVFGIGVSWEADIWGRIGGARRAAAMDALSEAALYNAARQSIAAQVVTNWIEINRNQALIEVSRREVTQRRGFLSDVQARVEQQAGLQVDVNRAQADLALARARLASVEGELPASVRALEVLLGRYPAGSLRTQGGLPSLPAQPGTGVPSQLLERRPDVVAAERRIASAFYRRSEAQAARLPRLTLNAGLTSTQDTLGDALRPDNLVWNIVGGLILPIIDGGRLGEEVNVANARQAGALANYGAIALTAFREVEDALSAERALMQELGHLNRAEGQLRDAIGLEEERYLMGEITQANVSDTRLTFFNVQRSQIALRAALLANRVQLHLALGGSFVAAPVAAPAGQQVAGTATAVAAVK